MWVVVYEDRNLGYKKASRVFDNEQDAWDHKDRLEALQITDPSIGIKATGVVEFFRPDIMEK